MTTVKLRDVPWFCSWTLNTYNNFSRVFFTSYDLCSCLFFFSGASSNIYLWLWPSTQGPHVIPLEPQLLPTISSNGEGISRIVPPKSWRSLHKVSFPVRGAILLTKNGERISFPPHFFVVVKGRNFVPKFTVCSSRFSGSHQCSFGGCQVVWKINTKIFEGIYPD